MYWEVYLVLWMYWWVISVLNMLILSQKSVYVAYKRTFNTQTLVQTLSTLLIFSKFKIVIFHIYSYIFIIMSNLQLLLAFMLWLYSIKGRRKKLACIFVIFFTAAESTFSDASEVRNHNKRIRQDEVAG